MTEYNNARYVALEVLLKWSKNNSFLNNDLDVTLNRYNLSTLDKALATRIVYGVCSKFITLDYVIAQFLSNPDRKLSDKIKMILRISLYQMMFMQKIPESAAVNTAVELIKTVGEPYQAGFINAVLRNYLRNKDNIKYPDKKDFVKYCHIKYSCPVWIIELWRRQYGDSLTEEILNGTEDSADLFLRVNTLNQTVDELSDKILKNHEGVEIKKSPLCDDILQLENCGNVRQISGFAEGQFFVQDPASRLASKALGARVGEMIADVCSAPGGKSFSIAMDMQNNGQLLSFDINEKKVKLVRDGSKRLGLTCIQARVNDGRRYLAEYRGKFDRVLCDVPCSGLGIMGKKPDIKTKTQDEISTLPVIQAEILQSSSNYVKNGGVLVYSTCTLNKNENENVVLEFIKKNPQFSLSPIENILPIEYADAAFTGMVTLIPKSGVNDGFFVARLLKN